MERTEFLKKLMINEELKKWVAEAYTIINTSMYLHNGEENPYLDDTVLQAREFSKYLQKKMENDVLSGVEVIKQEIPSAKKGNEEMVKKSMASMGYNKQIIEGA